LEGEWRSLAAALSGERKDLVPPWEELRKRVRDMQRSLDPVQPVFAYLEAYNPTESPGGYAALRIHVGNVVNLPVEVLGFEINGATFVPADPEWVQGNALVQGMGGIVLGSPARFPAVEYTQFSIPLSTIHRIDREIDFDRELEIDVATRIVSGSASQLTPVRYGLPAGAPQ
jgi:hypothetical protein